MSIDIRSDTVATSAESLEVLAKRIAHAASLTLSYRRSPVPPGWAEQLEDDFSSFVYVPPQVAERIRKAGDDEDPSVLLSVSWAAARSEGALRCYEGKIIFPLAVSGPDAYVEISIKPVSYPNHENKPWFLSYVDTQANAFAPGSTSPSSQLKSFAWLGDLNDFFAALAREALPEAWGFSNAPGREYEILRSYLYTTFYRLHREGKVCVSSDHRLAAFNTGLVTSRYDDLYACFEPNERPGYQPWRFAEFVTAGSVGLGKELVDCFNPLPQPASYFDRKEDLLFDLGRELVIDWDHVLIDNISRLPVELLEDEMRMHEGACEILRRLRELLGHGQSASESEELEDTYYALGDIIEDDPRVFRRLRARLKDALDMARRRVRWNYKTAIPSYYPRANTMSLLLPLAICDDDRVDAALVVQLMDSGNYLGQTILTMEQAYKNARLICRPDSDWLTSSAAASATVRL